MANLPQKVAIIGAGRVARPLALWFRKNGVEITQVYNRTAESAIELAKELDAAVCTDLNKLDSEVEMVVLAIADDAIAEVAQKLPRQDMIVVHTSGSRPMDDLKGHSKRGVFYPLQTFTKESDIDFQRIPICIEGNTQEVEEVLRGCCVQWRMQYYTLNSAQRAALHVAAVIANNFTNFLWGEAYDVLNKHNISTDILHPLMLETLRKATQYDPHGVQTGPAVRNDRETIQRHLEFLNDDEKLRDIYKQLTQQIVARHNDGEL